MITNASLIHSMMQDIVESLIGMVQELEHIGFLPDGCFIDNLLDEARLRDYLEDVIFSDEETVNAKWPDHVCSYGYWGLEDIAHDVDEALKEQAEAEAEAPAEESPAEDESAED